MAEIEKKWYALKAISGKEGKVKEYIDLDVKNHEDMRRYVSQVLIPTEKYQANVNNKRVVKERNLLPGYVLVEAALVGETQSRLRNVPNVLGFMSNERGSNTPTPLRPHEVARLLGAAEEKASEENFEFKIGDAIKVADGPFNGFDGIVEEVFTDKKKLKVSVKIFGRITPLELDFSQVGKE